MASLILAIAILPILTSDHIPPKLLLPTMIAILPILTSDRYFLIGGGDTVSTPLLNVSNDCKFLLKISEPIGKPVLR